jgi:purine-binding chemotaxis protein CheW
MPQRQRHDPSKNLVGFIVGDVHYAVSIHRVREIANPLTLVALPKAPAAVIGVADYRGDVVPIIDLRTRFGLEPGEVTRRTKWIIVDVDSRFVALVVDAVTEVFGTGGQELRPVPSLGGGDDVRGISGVTNHLGTLTFVLETRRFGELTEPLVKSGALKSSHPPPGSLPPLGGSSAPGGSSPPGLGARKGLP